MSFSVDSIIFDFDGVIVDSEHLRVEGFRKVLTAEPPELVEKLIEYHLANGGISRYEKFRYYLQELKGELVDENQVSRWAADFSGLMLESMADPSILIDETVTFIQKIASCVPLNIVSGSDEKELNALVDSLGLRDYFGAVRGSPRPKTKSLGDVIREFEYRSDQSIYIGDSMPDCDAARENGTIFWGFNNPSLREVSDRYVESFAGLDLAFVAGKSVAW